MVKKFKLPNRKQQRARSVPPDISPRYEPRGKNNQTNKQTVTIQTAADEPTAPTIRQVDRPPVVYEDDKGFFVLDDDRKKRIIYTAGAQNHQANQQTVNLVLSTLTTKAKRKTRKPRAPKLKPDEEKTEEDKTDEEKKAEAEAGKSTAYTGPKPEPSPEEQAADPKYRLGELMRRLIQTSVQNKKDAAKLLKRINLLPAGSTLSLLKAIEGRNPLLPGVALPSWVDFARGDRLGNAPQKIIPNDPYKIMAAVDITDDPEQKRNTNPFNLNPDVQPRPPKTEAIDSGASDYPRITEVPESPEEKKQREDRENQMFADLENEEQAKFQQRQAEDSKVEVLGDAGPIMSPPEMPAAAAAEPAAAAAEPDAQPDMLRQAAEPAAATEEKKAPRKKWSDYTEQEKKERLSARIVQKVNADTYYEDDDKVKDFNTIVDITRENPINAFLWYMKKEFIIDKNIISINDINALLQKYNIISDKVKDQLVGSQPEVYELAIKKIKQKLTPTFIEDYFKAREEVDSSTYDRKGNPRRARAKLIYEKMLDMANRRPQGRGNRKPSIMVGLYDNQIDDMMRHYPEYMGCISRDEIGKLNIPDNISRFGFVYNTVPSNKPTVNEGHWRAIFIDLDNEKEIDHYDSYGEPAEPDIQAQIKTLLEPFNLPYYLKWKDNRIIDQRANSNNCGYFATSFLMDRFAGKPFKDASGYSNIMAGERKARGLNKKFKYMT